MKDKAPIQQMLKLFSKSKKSLFCMPAHKGKENSFDITELDCSDNLHNPNTVIKESQAMSAQIFGAKKCFYVTTGSTTSIFIMLQAVKKYGKKIIISRGSHKSVYNAIGLFNIEPVIADDFDNLESLLTDGVIGTLITYPDYFGNCVNIKNIYGALKKHNKLLLSDSSHGGHFNENLNLINPNTYCDICCFSGFKTLNGLTQGSYLLLNNLELETDVKSAFNLIHTTSPSYVILESLEYAAVNFKNNKEDTGILNNIKRIKSIKGLIFENNDDIFKLVLNVKNLGITGFSAEKFLNALRIYPEFSTFEQVVFIISYNDKITDLDKLEKGLIKLSGHSLPKENIIFSKRDFKFERKLDYIKAVNENFEFTDIEDCAGKIAAANLGLYPPAVPIIIAGEVITKEFKDYMLNLQDRFFNIYDGKIKTVKKK